MDQPLEEEPSGSAYFPVSCTKLVVMSICTVGLYQIYWAWMCWECIRERDGRRLNPFWRSVYVSAIFFNFLLFWDVFRSTGDSKSRALGRSVLLGLVYAAFWFSSLVDEGAWPFLSILSFVALIPVQLRINAFNEREHPGHNPNRKYSRTNILAIVVSGLLIALAVVGWFFQPV